MTCPTCGAEIEDGAACASCTALASAVVASEPAPAAWRGVWPPKPRRIVLGEVGEEIPLMTDSPRNDVIMGAAITFVLMAFCGLGFLFALYFNIFKRSYRHYLRGIDIVLAGVVGSFLLIWTMMEIVSWFS